VDPPSWFPKEYHWPARELQRSVRELLRPLLRGKAYLDWDVHDWEAHPYWSVQPAAPEWSVAMAIAINRVAQSVATSKVATDCAYYPVGDGLPSFDLSVIAPGTRLKVRDKTRGHMLWPPESVLLKVLTGPLAGRRIEFIEDPDPRPYGPLAVVCAALLVDADEPILNDAEALARFGTEVAHLIVSTSLPETVPPVRHS
jgi:hypothetical protein